MSNSLFFAKSTSIFFLAVFSFAAHADKILEANGKLAEKPESVIIMGQDPKKCAALCHDIINEKEKEEISLAEATRNIVLFSAAYLVWCSQVNTRLEEIGPKWAQGGLSKIMDNVAVVFMLEALKDDIKVVRSKIISNLRALYSIIDERIAREKNKKPAMKVVVA